MRVFEQVSDEYPIGQAWTLRSTMVLFSEGMYIRQVTIAKTSCHLHRFLLSLQEVSNRLHRSLKHAESIGERSSVTLLRRLPVDDIPDVLDICSLAVLVLEIVRVLPLIVKLAACCFDGQRDSNSPYQHQRSELRPCQQRGLGPWSSRLTASALCPCRS